MEAVEVSHKHDSVSSEKNLVSEAVSKRSSVASSTASSDMISEPASESPSETVAETLPEIESETTKKSTSESIVKPEASTEANSRKSSPRNSKTDVELPEEVTEETSSDASAEEVEETTMEEASENLPEEPSRPASKVILEDTAHDSSDDTVEETLHVPADAAEKSSEYAVEEGLTVSKAVPEELPEELPKEVQEDTAETLEAPKAPAEVAEELPEKACEDEAKETPEETPEETQEAVTESAPQGTTEAAADPTPAALLEEPSEPKAQRISQPSQKEIVENLSNVSTNEDTKSIEEPEMQTPPATPLATVHEATIEEETAEVEKDERVQESLESTHDSMVTVRLSEPPALSIDTSVDHTAASAFGRKSSPAQSGVSDPSQKIMSPSSQSQRDSTLTLPSSKASRSLQDELLGGTTDDANSSSDDEVNWAELEKTEDEQSKDDEADNSTAMLLARLEQENAKLATNPKSVKVRVNEGSTTAAPRPPSMAQLRQMVTGPTPPALRYSMLPAPAMTDLEFFAALVKDYQQTAARLPTLLTNKVRKGIPPPLRGVVWQSMAGGRDPALEEQYDRYCGESSPYEFIIGKDLGRSFPGVEMFRETEGDGQRMLGRVLRAFSLYDTKIGYCQGLAFLVGPLLMHMPDKQAFCVLVRLMERYDLRGCFLPDLSGLHVRIYQFRELLRLSLPALASHLEELQVDPAYVSQWFLSFFAVTCPLPMLFRIYDVLFAEGASETLMRVGLSLMQKNETRLLACDELEDVMQLLLSRSLWDCYHYNADEFVLDFVSATGIVTREKLAQLEQSYKESLVATANVARSSAITTAATRFLDRIWASSTIVPKTTSLSPNLKDSTRPTNSLRRSTSKQSLASTLNSVEASSASITSSTSTNASTASRDSSNTEDGSLTRESTPVAPKASTIAKHSDDRYLHSQIEDLLTALSELQRNQALLTTQLQREREERDEDRKAVRSLLDGLRRKASTDSVATEESSATAKPSDMTGHDEVDESAEVKEDAETSSMMSTDGSKSLNGQDETEASVSTEDLERLLEMVENRFSLEDKDKKHRSSMMQSKAQLRDELITTKEQLASSVSHSQELGRRIHEQDQELGNLKEQLRESQNHARSQHQERQRLEKQLQTMRARTSACSLGEPTNRDGETDWPSKATTGGLRELKLGRSKSTPGEAGGYGKRLSSLPQAFESTLSPAAGSGPTPTSEQDALLLELVQAKTSEAMARQEAEEAKQKLEALRKSHGLAPVESPSLSATAGAAASGAMGVFGRLTGQGSWQSTDTTNASTPASTGGNRGSSTSTNTNTNNKPAAAAAATPPSTSSGGFWSWRR